MKDIVIQPLSYFSTALEKDVTHHIILANLEGKHCLLSIPNLYLYEKTRSSKETSKRYATLIASFYRYLSEKKAFRSIHPGDYHVHATNKDLRQWQVYRQTLRVAKNSLHPTSETIFNDVQVVLFFFKWLHLKNIPTGVKIHLKTWVANFKDMRILNYIEKKSQVIADTSSVRVLDTLKRQKRARQLISNADIQSLISSYPDPVYKTLFQFALATAMRPAELVKFPYIGNGKNRHIVPYSEMNQEHKTFKYEVLGKGNKLRDIIIPAYALQMIDDSYTKLEYPARAKLYKEKFGKKCPLSILFLTADGEPITAPMIANATSYAKRLAIEKDPNFLPSNKFYHTRKWWPTLMMIQHYGGDGILEKNAEVMDLAITQVIVDQLGHESLTTTHKHYLVLGRLLVMARKGITHEHIHEKTVNVHDAIAEYS